MWKITAMAPSGDKQQDIMGVNNQTGKTFKATSSSNVTWKGFLLQAEKCRELA